MAKLARREFWKHVTSGDSYAVGTDRFGTMLVANGPLHYSELIPEKLAELLDNGDADMAEGIAETVDDWTVSYSESAED